MRLERRGCWLALGTTVLGFACGGKGGGGTGPCTPGAATQLVKSGGDAQAWYFNNPLPTALSVKALDANNCAVPRVVVNWVVSSGDGKVTPAQSTTNASGVASATDSVGSAPSDTVTAAPAITSLPTLKFSVTAAAPPTSGAVDLINTSFSPKDVTVQVNRTVTWTWKDQPTLHNVKFLSGPAPLPAPSAFQNTNGFTYSVTFTQVGKYTYECEVHPGIMTGSVAVVH